MCVESINESWNLKIVFFGIDSCNKVLFYNLTDDVVLQLSSMTATLFVVSFVYFVLNVPSDIYYIGVWNDSTNAADIAYQEVFWAIVTQLCYLSNSINFILYFISGQKFRKAAFDILRSVRDRLCCPSRKTPECNHRHQSLDPIIVDQIIYTTQSSLSTPESESPM